MPFIASPPPQHFKDSNEQRFSTPVREQGQNNVEIMSSTPFRTPKSVKGKRFEPDRILGTPDYLAPELLLHLPHSYGVDWWGLGICLYEFMVGIPPFTDETPEKVFDNILNLKLEWPEENDEKLSDGAVQSIMRLLTIDQNERANLEDLKSMQLFQVSAQCTLLQKLSKCEVKVFYTRIYLYSAHYRKMSNSLTFF